MATCRNESKCWWFVGVVGFAGALAPTILCSANQALAQVIPDETLGENSSKIAPNVNIKGSQGDRIDGGAIHGANLFHSFQEFNVAEFQRVYFANPTGIENILTRVTGNQISKILGTLGVDGGANLFFLNPNGILFGNNARLDVNGSFVGSTAKSFVFGDGLEFSATHPQAPPLLKINLTPGLQYGHFEPSRTITNTGNLAAGQDLKLLAGNLDLHGQLQAQRDLSLQGNTVKVRDSVSNPFIAMAGGKLLVQGNESLDIFALNHPNSGLFSGGDMVLQSANTVGGDAHFWSGGSFRIEKLDGRLGNLFSPHDPVIRASGDVGFDSYTGASLHILAGGSVKIGTAIITGTDRTGNTIAPTSTPTLAKVILSDGTSIVIDGSQRPTLDVRAGVKPEALGNPLGISGNNFTLLFPPPANNPVTTSADITVNDVAIAPPNGIVLLTNQYEPNLSLTGGNIIIQGRNGINTPSVRGHGGDVILDARGNITLNSQVNTVASDNGGDITLLANSNLILKPGSLIKSGGLLAGNITLKSNADISGTRSTILSSNGLNLGQGQSGNITINAKDRVAFDELGTLISTFGIGTGSSGDINIRARSLSLTNGAELNTSTGEQGNAGKVNITATDTVSLDKSFILSRGGLIARGNSGDIVIDATSLFLSNGAELSSLNFGQGNAGNITINAKDRVAFDGLGTLMATSALDKGNSGNINIQARSLFLTNGAQLYSTISRPIEVAKLDTAGNIQVKVSDSVFVSGGAQFVTQAIGQGKAGDVIIEAGDRVSFDGEIFIELENLSKIFLHQDTRIFIQRFVDNVLRPALKNSDSNLPLPSGIIARLFSLPPDFIGKGEGGDIRITANSLLVTNDAELNTSTFGIGNAGDIIIRVKDTVTFDGQGSDAFSNVQSFPNLGLAGQGNGGNIDIQARSLFLKNAAEILALTAGIGDAGTITVKTTDSVIISGVAPYPFDDDGEIGGFSAGLFTDISKTATGGGGIITVTTDKLQILNGGAISARTGNDREGGNITVNANSILLEGGGQILTTAQGSGDAGEIVINVTDKIEMVGSDPRFFDRLDSLIKTFGEELALGTQNPLTPESGIFANTTSGSKGNSGSIFIDPRTITIRDGAKIAVNSDGSGIGGDIQLAAGTLTLNRGSISAETRSNTGGKITLNLQELLLLRNGSQISTTAGNQRFDGDGGNITINTPFIVAVPKENSDITANAFSGSGGQVKIKATGIFGIAPLSRDELITSLRTNDPSQLNPGKLPTNDISAISQQSPNLSGQVTINTPDTDPSRGLIQLPSNLIDASQQIAQSCTPRGEQTASRFIATGRGGLPLSPNEPLRGQTAIAGWVDLPQQTTQGVTEQLSLSVTKSTHQIVEAQGWIVDANGGVILVAQSPQSSSIPSVLSCNQ